MKKLLTLVTVLLLSVIAACSSSDVSTGSEGNSVEKKEEVTTETTEEVVEEQPEETGKTIDATAQTVTVLGMKVGLGEIKIAEDKISVGVNIENTSDGMLMFYPDQGQLVTGDMQLDSNMFLASGNIGGDVHSGVKQDAVLEFLAPEGKLIDVNAITEIRLIFGDVVAEDFMSSEPVEFTVPVQ